MLPEQRPAGECPSCSRFVGPYGRCPYCGADVGQRMVVRLFRYGSLLLALGGLAVLLFVATRAEAPQVEVEKLVGTMNWAHVRLDGVVTRQPSYDPATGTLKFWIWDGTGEILVMAYRSEAEVLLAEGLAPVVGDQVAVEGTLRVRDDFQYLVLDVPQHTEIQPAVPVELSIAEVDLGLLYQVVTVRGMIRGDRTPYEGLRILTLRDATGQIDVTMPTGDSALLGEVPDLRLGQALQMTGAVDQYKGKAQLAVGRGSDLVLLEEAITIAPERRLGQLSVRDTGAMALVEGTIVRADPFSAGVKCRLDDGSGFVTLLLWQDLVDSLVDPGAFVAGTRVRVQGEVAEYQGELEVVPQIVSDVVVVATGEAIVEDRQLGELSEVDAGRVVAVQGVLRTLQMFSAGAKGTLDDGTGTATLLLWQDVYDGLADRSRLVPGAVVDVQGEVGLYQGELEVIPRLPAHLSVTGLVELPADRRTVGQVSSADAGQVIELSGRVVEARSFSRGMRYLLDDDTGTITLLLWQDIYERAAQPDLLAVGAEVLVRGEVAEYLGELEIVPRMPEDVQVTALAGSSMGRPTAPAGIVTSSKASPVPAGTLTPEPTVATPEPTAEPVLSPTPQATATPEFETRTIGAISGDDVGRTFTIARAGIGDVDFFSRGVKYRLEDGSGSMILLVWQNVLEEVVARYDLVPGSLVEVTGEVDEYAGDLEIIPHDGTELQVLAVGERLPIEERAAADVTASDQGRIFAVQGAVVRTESADWLKVWLGDGTGEILIFVPERTVPYLPAGIGAGVRLRVTGSVDIYQGVVEIIPLAGVDVEVLGP